MKITNQAIKSSAKKKGVQIYNSIPFGVVAVLMLSTCQLCLMGCGGGGGTIAPKSTAALQQQLGSAQTAGQYQSFIFSVNQKIALGTGVGPFGKILAPSPALNSDYAGAIAAQPAGSQQSIAQVFSAVTSPAPTLKCPVVPKFSSTLDEVLSQLNADLLLAPANPETPINSLLLLLTYDPTNPGATPTPLTTDTELSPAQALIFGTLLSSFVTATVTNPDPALGSKSPPASNAKFAAAVTIGLAVIAEVPSTPKATSAPGGFWCVAIVGAIIYFLLTQDLQGGG